jgi:tetratricopeptide (TPR) repeat protein
MSMNIQNQIRQNATNMRDYFKDLNQWTKDIETKPKPQTTPNHPSPPIRGQVDTQEGEDPTPDPINKLSDPAKVRDSNTIGDYYSAWDKFDPDAAEKDLETQEKTTKQSLLDKFSKNEEGLQKAAKTKLIVKGTRGRQKTDVEAIKENANLMFKERKYNEAIEEYDRCLKCIESESENLEDNLVMYTTLLSNKAQAWIYLGELQKAIGDCSKVLSLAPTHVKSLFRRATCYKKLKNWRGARADIAKSLEIQKGDRELTKELNLIDLSIKKIKNDILGKMDLKMSKSGSELRRIMVKDMLDSKLEKNSTSKPGAKIPEDPIADNESLTTSQSQASTKDTPKSENIFKSETSANPDFSKIPQTPAPQKKYEDFFKAPTGPILLASTTNPAEFLQLRNVDGNFGKSIKGGFGNLDMADEKIITEIPMGGQSQAKTQDLAQNGKKVSFQIFQDEST